MTPSFLPFIFHTEKGTSGTSGTSGGVHLVLLAHPQTKSRISLFRPFSWYFPSTYLSSSPNPSSRSPRSPAPQLRSRSPLGSVFFPQTNSLISFFFLPNSSRAKFLLRSPSNLPPNPGPKPTRQWQRSLPLFPSTVPSPPHLIHWFVPHHFIRCSVLPSPSFTSFHSPFPLTPFHLFPFFLLPTFLFSLFI